MKRHELTDEQWALVDPYLPLSTARTGRPPRDRRTLLNAVFWILCTGAPWRDLPERFGPWQTAYDHFCNWRRTGVFASIIEVLQVKLDDHGYTPVRMVNQGRAGGELHEQSPVPQDVCRIFNFAITVAQENFRRRHLPDAG